MTLVWFIHRKHSLIRNARRFNRCGTLAWRFLSGSVEAPKGSYG